MEPISPTCAMGSGLITPRPIRKNPYNHIAISDVTNEKKIKRKEKRKICFRRWWITCFRSRRSSRTSPTFSLMAAATTLPSPSSSRSLHFLSLSLRLLVIFRVCIWSEMSGICWFVGEMWEMWRGEPERDVRGIERKCSSTSRQRNYSSHSEGFTFSSLLW